MTDCRTRYPLLLIHGLNCRDDWIFPYWGRVADILRTHGATVYLSGQDAWGSIPGNAQALRRRAEDILSETGSEKLNLLAHSKGGLEARYLISTLGFAPKAASLTTICTPHQGSKAAAEWLARERICRIAGRGLEGFWRARGDRDPDFPAAVSALTPEAMARFNRENPDSPLVYYQSWGARLDGRLGPYGPPTAPAHQGRRPHRRPGLPGLRRLGALAGHPGGRVPPRRRGRTAAQAPRL